MKRAITRTKVCFVTQEIPPIFVNGGAGTATLGYSQDLASSPEFDVTVLYSSFSSLSDREKGSIVRDFKSKSIKLYFLEDIGPQNLWNRTATSKSLSIMLFLNQNDFHIVHFNDFDGLAFYSVSAKRSGIYLNKTHINIICHGNSRWGLEVSRFFPSQQDLEIFDLERLSLIYADSIMSPSEYLLNWMRDNNLENKSVNLLQRNIMPTDESDDYGSRAVIRQDVKKIVFFGRHEVRKGLLIFLDSINRILRENSKLEVYFIGKTQIIDGQNSSDIISRFLVEHKSRINIIGPLSRDDVREFISATDVLTVMPSIAENLPFTVYECLKWNVKFIASNSGGTSEFFIKGLKDERLFDPNSNALYSKMMEFLVKQDAEVGGLAINDIDSRNMFQKFHHDSFLRLTQTSLEVESFPSATVILISHNRTEYLEQALAALVAQSITSFQVIIVDDGSYLKSHLDFIEELKHRVFPFSLRTLRTEDIGLGNARNFGVGFSDSKYIIFLDDDNIPTTKFVENLVLAAEHSDADAVVALANTFFGDSFPSSEIDYENLIYFPLGESVYSGILKNSYGDSQGLWRRESFLSLGGFEDSGLPAEDWHIYSKACLNSKRILVVPFVGYFYRQHADSMTSKVLSTREYKHRVAEIYAEKFGPLVGPFLQLAANVQSNQAPSEPNLRIAIENVKKTYDNTTFILSRVLLRISKGINLKGGSNVSLFKKIQISLRYYGFKRLIAIGFGMFLKLIPAFFRIRVISKSVNLLLFFPVLDTSEIIGGQYFLNPADENYEISVELIHSNIFKRLCMKPLSIKSLIVPPGLDVYSLLDLFKHEIKAENFAKVKVRVKPSRVGGLIYLL